MENDIHVSASTSADTTVGENYDYCRVLNEDECEDTGNDIDDDQGENDDEVDGATDGDDSGRTQKDCSIPFSIDTLLSWKPSCESGISSVVYSTKEKRKPWPNPNSSGEVNYKTPVSGKYISYLLN